jgi:hypothetical protein
MTDTYDRDLRPGLVMQMIADHQGAGVEVAFRRPLRSCCSACLA